MQSKQFSQILSSQVIGMKRIPANSLKITNKHTSGIWDSWVADGVGEATYLGLRKSQLLC